MRSRWPFLLGALALSAAAPAQFPGAATPPATVKAGFDAITIADAQRHLGYLAGPECEGRGTGQPGYQKAADYVAARFREYGLKPMGDDGTYFQNDTMWRSKVVEGTFSLGGKTVSLADGLHGGKLAAEVHAQAPVILVRVRERNQDLPKTVSLAGAIVLLAGPGVDGSIRIDVRGQEPAAILNVKDVAPATVWEVARRMPTERRAVGTISTAAAKTLLGARAGLLDEAGAEPVEVATIGQGALDLVAKVEEVKVPNVVGAIEGSDPLLRAEVVGLGAHLDHMGTDGTTTYWGADDDGSGSTALIQVARAMSANPIKPRRTVLFVAFFGEEMGLLGSTFYAKNPAFPIEKMVAHLQMDMVGRDSYGVQNGDPSRVDKEEENRDTMRLVGSQRLSMDLHRTILGVNRFVNFRFLYDGEDVYTRSDHYVFAARGVPVAFLFDGFTPDYHQPTDTVDKINWLKLTNSAKLFFLTAIEVANRNQAPAKDGTDVGK